MADTSQIIDGRFIRNTSIGSVQAFAAGAGEVSVVMNWYAHIKRGCNEGAYSSTGLYLSVDDARDLAATLVKAADFAEASAVVKEEA